MKIRHHRRIGVLLSAVALCTLLCACSHEHDFGRWKVDKESTCTEDGQKIRTCECGEKETKTIKATGHNAGAWITDKEATCTEDGSKHQTCDICNETISTETLPSRGGHSYTSEVTTQSACDQDGLTTYTCTACAHSYTEPIIHPSYTATQIHENYLNSVGEILTYDRNGNEYSLGTCFVYSEDGKLITNYHVIEDGYSAKVTLGEQVYDVAYVLAYDKNIDVAILKINATGLTPSVLCDSTHKVGEVVYAFGNSQGLTATFSDGMITYSSREIEGVMYVQHDAPISSGNSGGPLINKYGEVIGINTWTVRDSQNLNFAIHVSELDNLVYGDRLTMAQFFEKECNPFLKLKNYIMSEGTRTSDGYYRLILGTSYSSDYSSSYTRVAYYYPDTDKITLDFLIDDGDAWAYIEVYDDLSGIYDLMFLDNVYNDYIGGLLYASSFNSNTTLSYDTYSFTSYSTLDTARKLARTMIYLLMSNFDQDFSDIGITAGDLGFVYF